MKIEFERVFEQLTGNRPFPWQRRLYDHFVERDGKVLPSVIDLPTGLGKTMVMAIWLIARAENPLLPRRLVYVVDRRTVVDQATDLAVRIAYKAKTLSNIEVPLISTLRGQLADNREWSRDPSKPAIIIGTVDLIGSGLLFSGYRSSYKQRPLHAGLLGQDSLLVLDEAHLSKPFAQLLVGRKRDDGTRQNGIEQFQSGQFMPMKVIRMSATTEGEGANRFKLEDTDLSDGIIEKRFNATKGLTIAPPVEKNRLNDALKSAAIALAQDESLKGKRIVVFVRSPDDAMKIADLIRKHESAKNKSGPFVHSVEVLTGTMRGLERDELINKQVFEDRWLNGNLEPSSELNQKPVFLISTSAGEVGFDLNGDHMVSDQTTIDSFIQRLGRVNRRGGGEASIVLIPEIIKRTDKDGKPRKLSDLERAILNTLDLLKDQSDVSPRSIDSLKKDAWKESYADACSPPPTMVELTDILLDAWSMTSITEPMPGRPEVAPWIRGIDDELPQTTIAWRAELDLFKDMLKPEKAFKAIFAKHRIRPHESLKTNSYRVVEFLKMATRPKGGRPELRDTRVVVKLSREIVIKTVGDLIEDDRILSADPTLILPATFGGLDESGMLSHEAIPAAPKPEDPPLPSLDVADKAGYEPREDTRARLRFLIERTDDDHWHSVRLPGGEPIPEALELEERYDTSTLLFKAIAKKGFRAHLVQPYKFDEEGDPVQSLVMLATIGNKSKNVEQTLTYHVNAVSDEAQRIGKALELKDPFLSALIFAAKWHDEGKRADIWQLFIGGPDQNGEMLGKAATTRDPKSLKGYRHEFGSLLHIHHPDRHKTACTLPTDSKVCNLALHLIATHHGFGRPHFDNVLAKLFTTRECEALHTDSIRRFARLQRTYGHWHLAWLENLLRCADALASADQEAEDDVADESTDLAGGAK